MENFYSMIYVLRDVLHKTMIYERAAPAKLHFLNVSPFCCFLRDDLQHGPVDVFDGHQVKHGRDSKERLKNDKCYLVEHKFKLLIIFLNRRKLVIFYFCWKI